MANTPGNAPPSVNRLDAFMRSKSPSAEIGMFNQDPQAAAVMAWLATPEAQALLRRVVTEQGMMDQPGEPPPGAGHPAGPPSGGHFRPHERRPVPPPPTAPGMGPSPAPGVPGGTRDLSDPESFGPQGGHPLAGIGGAIAGAFDGPRPVFDPRTGRQLHVDPNTFRGVGRAPRGGMGERARMMREIAAGLPMGRGR